MGRHAEQTNSWLLFATLVHQGVEFNYFDYVKQYIGFIPRSAPCGCLQGVAREIGTHSNLCIFEEISESLMRRKSRINCENHHGDFDAVLFDTGTAADKQSTGASYSRRATRDLQDNLRSSNAAPPGRVIANDGRAQSLFPLRRRAVDTCGDAAQAGRQKRTFHHGTRDLKQFPIGGLPIRQQRHFASTDRLLEALSL